MQQSLAVAAIAIAIFTGLGTTIGNSSTSTGAIEIGSSNC